MKNIRLSHRDDLTAVPSGTLNRETLAVMRRKQAEKNAAAYRTVTSDLPASIPEERPAGKSRRLKKAFICAAAACAAVFLMGMGVRVFEYLTFVPGMGIVTAQQEEVYTLKNTLDAGEHRIEAMSVIPITEGENKGLWWVNVMTDYEISGSSEEFPAQAEPMYITGSDGEKWRLNCSGGNTIGSRYRGIADISGGAGAYTLSWYGEEYTAVLTGMENTVWAEYAYPVHQGLTVIAFPMTEDSQYLLFDVILDPESENLMFWAQHCGNIAYSPLGIVVTDTEGNQYEVHGSGGRTVHIPDSEKSLGVNAYLDYKWERICTLDRPLEAPIAKVEVSEIIISFRNVHGVGTYTATIPVLGETVYADDLPNGGRYLDTHGITLHFDSIFSRVDTANNEYDVVFTAKYAEPAFEENITRLTIFPGFIEAKRSSADPNDFRGGGTTFFNEETGISEAELSAAIAGYGDLDTDTLALTFGEEITFSIRHLEAYISGNWVIDFSEKQ